MEFNLEQFKKWLSKQKDETTDTHFQSRLIGLEVESKLHNPRRFAKNIESYDGDLHEIAVNFIESGGNISDVDGKVFYIETEGGSFTIQRCFVKKKN